MKSLRLFPMLLLLSTAPLSAQECLGWPGGPMEGSIAVQHQRAGGSRIYSLELAGQLLPNVAVALTGSTLSHVDGLVGQGVDQYGPYLGLISPSHAFDVTLAAGPFPWLCLLTGYSKSGGWKIQKYYLDDFGRIIDRVDEDLETSAWGVPAGLALGRSLRTGPLSLTPHLVMAYQYERIESTPGHDWTGSAGIGLRYQWLAGKVVVLRSLRLEDARTWVGLALGAHLR